MKNLRALCFLLGALLFSPSAWAASTSFQGTLGSGAGFGAWCVGGSGASCSGGAFWPGTVITTSGGVELFTSGNAAYVQFPSAQAVTVSGVATAALQGTNSATTAHTCAITGFSELGCLGQMDDDIKATGAVNPGTAGNWGIGATGSAPPANGVYLGASTGGNLTGLVACNSHVFKHITSATDTLAVQGVTSQIVKVCGYKSSFAGTNAVFLENTASTNANCSSSNTQITGQDSGVAQSVFGFMSAFWTGLANTSGNGLCINSTGSGAVDVDIWFTQGS